MSGGAGPRPAPAPVPGALSALAGRFDRLVGRLRRAGVALESPILVRELRTLLRGRKFFVSHILLLVVLSGVLLIARTTVEIGGAPDSSAVGGALFFAFTIGLGAVVIFLVPAFSCTAITTEREGRTLDLLLTTTIRPWEVIWGKLLSALAVILLFMVSALPLVSICFLFGGISPWDLAGMYLAVVFATLIISSTSLVVSAHCRESKSAVVIAYVLTLVLSGLMVPALVIMMGVLSVRSMSAMSAGLSMLPGSEQALIIIIPLFLSVSVFALNFAAAANCLKPPTANRSTNLRAIWLAFLLGCVALFVVTLEVCSSHNRLTGSSWAAVLGMTAILAPTLLWISTIYFASEETRLAPRLMEDSARLKGLLFPLRVFMPGPASGLAYAAACVILVLGGVVFYTWTTAGLPGGAGAYFARAALPVGLFLLTAAGLAALFSSFGLKHRPAGFLAFGASALLGFGPMIHLGCQQAIDSRSAHSTLWNMHYLCPVLAGTSAWSDPQADRRVTLFAPDDDVPTVVPPPRSAAAMAPIPRAGMPLWKASVIAYSLLTLAVWAFALVRIGLVRDRWKAELARARAESQAQAAAVAQGLPIPGSLP